MADLKISQFAVGNLITPTDIVAGVRGGVNTKFIFGSMAAESAADYVTKVGVETLSNKTFDTPTLINVNSSGNALEIRHIGAGNCLYIEDTANPDATPWVVNSDGRQIIGSATEYSLGTFTTIGLQLHGTLQTATLSLTSWSSGTDTAASLHIARSDSGIVGTFDAIDASDVIGNIRFWGSDNSAFSAAGKIRMLADGVAWSTTKSARMEFFTSNGTSEVVALSLNSSQHAIFANKIAQNITSANNDVYFRLGGSISDSSGGTSVTAFYADPSLPNAVTANAFIYRSRPLVSASTALSGLTHFYAEQQTLGAGATVGTQVGFFVAANMSSATNNYAFRGQLASATGTYNLFMDGTAACYIAGRILSGNSSQTLSTGGSSAWRLSVLDTSSANTSVFGLAAASTAGPRNAFMKSRAAAWGSFSAVQSGDSLGEIRWFGDDGVNYSGEAARIQVLASANATSGALTANMRFLTSNGVTTPTEAMMLAAAGNVYFPRISTSASSANAVINNGSTPANELLRISSSLYYKTDVEDLDFKQAQDILELRPVFYRSKCDSDNPNWSFHGFIAEEVAKVNPRLVNWGFQDHQFEEVEVDREVPVEKTRIIEKQVEEEYDVMVKEKHGKDIIEVPEKRIRKLTIQEEESFTEIEIQKVLERRLKKNQKLVPDGVAYDRLTVGLVALVQDLNKRVKALEGA